MVIPSCYCVANIFNDCLNIYIISYFSDLDPHQRAHAHSYLQRSNEPRNPFARNTFDWWTYAIQNKLELPRNSTFLATHSCECSCSVANATAAEPFACACDCPALEAGEAGDVGIQGPQGEQGLRGAIGDRGEPGELGPTGPSGPKGEQGERGVKGLKGMDGASGRPGRSVPGPEGPPGPDGGLNFGPDGQRGPPGPRGFKGAIGPDGDNLRGPSGPRGYNGAGGDTGDRGSDGPPGPAGPVGPVGPRGITGPATPNFQPTNIMGQVVAQGACTGLMTQDIGYVAAVLRDCSETATCEDACAKLFLSKAQFKGKCFDSLQVSAATSKSADESGLVSRRFATCMAKSCEANYCCCNEISRSRL